MDLQRLREEYEAEGLCEAEAASDPLEQFQAWFTQAELAGIEQPNAMALSTVAPGGRPKTRVVLLKGFDARGFLFFTNYTSEKAQQLDGNPRVALTFLWLALHRQVRVEGAARRVDQSESDEYFATRPRGAQIGAWASDQSNPISDRRELQRRFAEAERRLGDGPITRPPHWGGYLVHHDVVEFWQGQPNRMHDRLRYSRRNGGWHRERLQP